MENTPQKLGWKLFGIQHFAGLGLFRRNFVILDDVLSQVEVIKKLKKAGFKDNNWMALRFSSRNSMNLPFFLGKFTLKKAAKIIMEERRDYVPFVNGLVKSTFSATLYFDGKIILIEVWPGIGASKTKVFNESPDIIKIDSKIVIARYIKNRKVENIDNKVYVAKPFTVNFLKDVAREILKSKNKIKKTLKIQKPLLCDLNCESVKDMNFMGIQKTKEIDIKKIFELLQNNFCVIKSFDDLQKYKNSKNIFFDLPLNRNSTDWHQTLKILKKQPVVYVKSLTMHLAVILRELGIKTQRAILNTDYEITQLSRKALNKASRKSHQ